ncbi:MAG TPA: lipoyl(octanoyl) transferase LipB [Dehalococcoidia bacterium]|nr:lipoyl(octanoyl) transferase LipB [Dehalococcoidia bacterium]
MSGTTVHLLRPGTVDYHHALSWQQLLARGVRDGTGQETLLLLQHPPVYTLGRRAKAEHILVDPAEILARGAEIVDADRGGDITFHGPGQLVGYPVLDLRGRGILPGDYVRLLEDMLVRALAEFGIPGERVQGRPGVWAGGAKIAAIGVRVREGVTTHGFALNVSTDLSWFEAIVPCGLRDASVTSMAALLAEAPPMDAVQDAVAEAFAVSFGVALIEGGFAVPAPAGERLAVIGR